VRGTMELKSIIRSARSVAESPFFVRVVKLGLIIAAVVHGYIISFGRSFHFRDIDIHREIGRRFLTGEYLPPPVSTLPRCLRLKETQA
jgi:alpha-1,2-mannosyltransferase